jgi:predicted GNAT superfamily acetyltransferase
VVAQWNICDPHVERRVSRVGPVIRAADTLDAVRVLELQSSVPLAEPGTPDLDQEGRRLLVEIPARFAPIQGERPDLAARWRAATRGVFTTYFGRGYRALDFWRDGARGCGTYLLARPEMAERQEAA